MYPLTPLPLSDPGALEKRAKEKLSEGGWYYASSNAGSSTTHLANRQAFYRHRIIPRMLRDTNQRDTRAEIWGHKVSAPIGFSPIGINKIYHPDGEIPVAKVAKELNLPYCLSTAGSSAIEDVGKANGEGPRFFQLYMPHDDELTVSLLKRAYESGFSACMLTVDTWQLGWRHNDIANSNYAFYHGIGADLGLTDPVFKKRLAEDGIDPKTQPNEAGAKWIDNVWHGRAHSWDRMPWLIKTWKEISGGKPFAIKGIQSVADAKKAVEVGCDGIVVSNHAGRQVDGAIASLDALENIVNGKSPLHPPYHTTHTNTLFQPSATKPTSCTTAACGKPRMSSRLWQSALSLSSSAAYGSGDSLSWASMASDMS